MDFEGKSVSVCTACVNECICVRLSDEIAFIQLYYVRILFPPYQSNIEQEIGYISFLLERIFPIIILIFITNPPILNSSSLSSASFYPPYHKRSHRYEIELLTMVLRQPFYYFGNIIQTLVAVIELNWFTNLESPPWFSSWSLLIINFSEYYSTF